MVSPRRHPRRLVWLVLLGVSGCEQQDPLPTVPPPPVSPARSAWRMLDESARVAVPPGDPELAAAVQRARATAEDARQRWLAVSEAERRHWSIKWAAPTVEATVEHVWVTPLAWTRFRVEGRLANQPQRELECAKVAGELVSFSTEELSDWVHLIEGRVDGPREGGFTMELLERRYGEPG